MEMAKLKSESPKAHHSSRVQCHSRNHAIANLQILLPDGAPKKYQMYHSIKTGSNFGSTSAQMLLIPLQEMPVQGRVDDASAASKAEKEGDEKIKDEQSNAVATNCVRS